MKERIATVSNKLGPFFFSFHLHYCLLSLEPASSDALPHGKSFYFLFLKLDSGEELEAFKNFYAMLFARFRVFSVCWA